MSKVDKLALAEKMLEWERLKRDLDIAEAQISGMVLELGETVVTGNVRATYRKPRKSYDYEAAAWAALGDKAADYQENYTNIRTTIDWRAMCKDQFVQDIPYTESDPSVSLKLEG